VEQVVEPGERPGVAESAGALLTVVTRAFGDGEENERVLGGQRGCEFRCAGADVVTFGVTDPGGAGDVFGVAGQGVATQGVEVGEGTAHAVNELTSPQRLPVHPKSDIT
jgi:hypothetical protein